MGKSSACVGAEVHGELVGAAAAFTIKHGAGADECFVFSVVETVSQRMDILFIWENSSSLHKTSVASKAVLKIDFVNITLKMQLFKSPQYFFVFPLEYTCELNHRSSESFKIQL